MKIHRLDHVCKHAAVRESLLMENETREREPFAQDVPSRPNKTHESGSIGLAMTIGQPSECVSLELQIAPTNVMRAHGSTDSSLTIAVCSLSLCHGIRLSLRDLERRQVVFQWCLLGRGSSTIMIIDIHSRVESRNDVNIRLAHMCTCRFGEIQRGWGVRMKRKRRRQVLHHILGKPGLDQKFKLQEKFDIRTENSSRS